ncbi:hypothetical protein ACIQ9P_08040 [Kitasatospora sp. NPDC094019]|uniref:hypothetical protein n=1 Tax=Kitasatospora sp. NPDC094019 TaxID=3364091 RepID=UPI00382DA276
MEQGAAFNNNYGPVQIYHNTVKYLSVHWGKLLGGVTVLLVLVGAVWGGWHWREANRDLDITSAAQLEGDRPTPVEGVLTLRLDGPPKRSHLRLTLTLAEGQPKSQLCLPDAFVEIRSDDGTDAAATALKAKQVADALNGKPVIVPLVSGSGRPRLLLLLRAGTGCRLDVGVARMVLTND